ncbi:MAG: nucleotide exchange factor GrpE [Verrucomicrobia bacterium]|nr:nucleotide exchange factor GrpE [Verrucomicrobiota bacterium]
MTERPAPVLAKWPFFLGTVLLLAVAGYIVQQSPRPLNLTQVLLLVSAVAVGALLVVVPFVLEYRAALKFAEADALADAVAQLDKLQTLAKQIGGATAQWQDVQSAAGKTAASAKEITDQMAVEVANFTAFMKQANDTEKSALRLEVDKARRAEGEWLQIIVRLLDHVFALHQAASRSGQPELVEQLTHFQNACREVARRVGLLPLTVEPNEPFDGERHKLLDAETAPAGALVGEVLACGYTYQGRLLRPALVKLQAAAPAAPAETAAEPTLL